jgi:hypothetical protein
MVNNNRLQSIWTGLARSNRYSAYVEEEDIQSFIRRAGSEGAEFYARGLTTLRGNLLAGIEAGQIVISGRFGLKRGTSLPRFMYRAFSLIFQPEDGVLKHDYDVGAVSCLNQLLAVFGKILGGHTPESESAVADSFLRNEEFLRANCISEDEMIGNVPLRNILDQAHRLVSRVLARACPREITPKHGSGSSACGTPVRDRYSTPRYVRSIDQIWPMSEFYYANMNHLCDEYRLLNAAEDYDPVAKVLLVPKDARGPRLISCEPRETMFIQLGLMDVLYTTIESHPLTRRSVNFTDQTYNQRAAYRGSKDRSLATLDLKDASDRFRLDLMQRIFPFNWACALTACRSGATLLPSGQVVPLAKHAPMGSACCFPVMALGIWAILTATLPPGTKVLVYGDDIVVPTQYSERAMQVLEAVHLVVNRNKSYVQGPFRESCGKEYIDGVDITPVRLRMNPCDDSAARARTIAFANNLFVKFRTEQCWLTSLIHEWYRFVPERNYDPEVGELVPTIELRTHWDITCRLSRITDYTLSSVLNVWSANNIRLKTKRCKKTSVRLYRYLVSRPVEVKYSTDRWSQLYRTLVNPRQDVPLGCDALPKRVSYKYAWAPL